MDVSEAARLKALEDENAKLKRLLADTMLDNVVLKDLLGKELTTLTKRRDAALRDDAGSRHLATPGVQACRCRSEDSPA